MSPIKFRSTRAGAGAPTFGIREAIDRGLAPDGGLLVPTYFPKFDPRDFESGMSVPELGTRLLGPFFESDPDLTEALPAICASAFNFPTPVVPVPGRKGDFFLELFHGPT